MKRARTPLRFIRPMECLKLDRIPEGELWQYELKLDGYHYVAIKQDAHRDDGRRFVVHADEKLSAFVELEAAIRAG